MKLLARRRLLLTWLALSTLTLIYLWMDQSVDDNGVLRPSSIVTASAIVIALVKVRIIFRQFMDVRHAPTGLRVLTDAWVIIMATALLGSYFISLSIASP